MNNTNLWQCPQKHLCYAVDPIELADVLGLQVDFQYLTKDGSVLGLTTPEEALIPVLDMDGNPFLYHLDGRTVLVEQRWITCSVPWRRNFTIAHEIAHQILYRLFPEAYGMQRRTLCDYRRSSKPCKQITDWAEWQADTLGAAILLPEDAVQEGMFIFGLGDQMTVLSKKYSPNKFEAFCRMADFLGASRTTLLSEWSSWDCWNGTCCVLDRMGGFAHGRFINANCCEMQEMQLHNVLQNINGHRHGRV